MGDFKLDLWLKKFGRGLLLVMASTGLVYTAEQNQATDLPPDYAFWGGLIAICCMQIGNYVKHTVGYD